MGIEEELAATAALLREFRVLPQQFRNKPVVIRFTHKRCFERCATEECDALGLAVGNVVKGELWFDPLREVAGGGGLAALLAPRWPLYAIGETASQLLALPEGRVVIADGCTLFDVGFRVRRLGDERWRVQVPYEGIGIVSLRPAEAEPGAAPDPAI